MLLDMRTDGEITKEEFLHQRQKLDTEIQSLTAEYENLSHSTVITLEQPEWGKIQDTLEEADDTLAFRWVINLQTIQTTIVFSAPLVMPHRLQLRKASNY